jgi:hypothetical protein
MQSSDLTGGGLLDDAWSGHARAVAAFALTQKRRARPLGRLLLVVAVAQTNRGVVPSQPRPATILSDPM